MRAIGLALPPNPSLDVINELTEDLAPVMVKRVVDVIHMIHGEIAVPMNAPKINDKLRTDHSLLQLFA